MLVSSKDTVHLRTHALLCQGVTLNLFMGCHHSEKFRCTFETCTPASRRSVGQFDDVLMSWESTVGTKERRRGSHEEELSYRTVETIGAGQEIRNQNTHIDGSSGSCAEVDVLAWNPSPAGNVWCGHEVLLLLHFYALGSPCMSSNRHQSTSLKSAYRMCTGDLSHQSWQIMLLRPVRLGYILELAC